MDTIEELMTDMRDYLDSLDNGGEIWYCMFEEDVKLILKNLEND